MQFSRIVLTVITVAAAAVCAGFVSAQTFPVKTIRIVTAGVGGGSDFTSRQIAQGISGPLGQPVIVDNRPSGVIPGDTVAKSAPDGYTLLVTSNTLWLTPFLRSNVPYDPVRDFATISWTNFQPNILVIHPSLPVKSVKELIALAKAKPGQLVYSTGTSGTINHLASELFKIMAKVDMVRVPYKSGASETADLIGGHVQMTFGSSASVIPHVKSGKLKALAVGTAKPTSVAPGVPTIAASGLPGYQTSGTITGIWAPAKTPDAVITRLSQEIMRHLRTPEAKERFLAQGAEAVGSTPEEFAAAIKSDMATWGKVIKDAGIKED